MIDVQWLDAPSDDDFRGIAGVVNAFWSEVIQDEPPCPAAELAAGVRTRPAHRRVLVGVVREDGQIIGAVDGVCDGTAGREHVAGLRHLVVAPAHRRRGVGRALLDATVDRARSEGRSLLSHFAPRSHLGSAAFARAVGAREGLVEMQNRLRVDELDPSLLRGWIDRANERASGYSLVAFDDVCPDEHLEAFTRVTTAMNTAPRSDATVDSLPTPEQVRQNAEAFVAQGHRMWTICARDDMTGEFAGYTELAFSRFRPWLALQQDTAVFPHHRDRGLGRWIKAVNALRMVDERPEVTHIETWNADVNAAMLAINDAMGYRAVAEWQEWELEL